MVLSATASVRPDNTLIAEITATLDREAHVYVEYGNEEVGLFRTATTTAATRHTVSMARLRSSTTYDYEVFVIDVNGQVSDGMQGAFTSGPLPLPLDTLEFTVTGKPTAEIVMMDVRDQKADYLFAIDQDSEIVWYYISSPVGSGIRGVTQKPNFNLVFCLKDDFQGLREITPLGQEVDRLVAAPLNGDCHHETLLNPIDSGRILYMSFAIETIDDTSNGGETETRVNGDTIREWDQKTHTSEVLWNVFDFISPEERVRWRVGGWQGFDNRPTFDWTHGNSLSIGPRGNMIVSLRHTNQIISIAPDFESIEWRLGGPGSDFDFPDPSDRFYHQHSAIELPNGNILLFDNGNTRPAEEGGEYSRALELVLDDYDMVARKLWEYRHDPDIFSSSKGNVSRLEGGNVLIAFDGRGIPLVTVEVDAEGAIIWEHSFTSPTTIDRYRAYALGSLLGETRIR